MKTDWKQIVVLSAALALTGCGTSGLSRRERPGTYPAYIISLQPDSVAASPREMKFPLKLAVVPTGETAPDDDLLKKLEDDKRLIRSVATLPAPADIPPEHASGIAPREESPPTP